MCVLENELFSRDKLTHHVVLDTVLIKSWNNVYIKIVTMIGPLAWA